MTSQGKLFVFEGPDGVGKTALAQALSAYLNAHGRQCDYLAFPGREEGTLGQHVYRLHHNPESFGITSIDAMSLQMMHVAAHIDMIGRRIRPTLHAGQYIVLDRFWWSTWIYGLTAGIDRPALERLLNIEHLYWQDILPTIIFVISRTTPLRADEEPERWHRLSAAYEELAHDQQYQAIQAIRNEHSLKEGLDQIVAAIVRAEGADYEKPTVPSHLQSGTNDPPMHNHRQQESDRLPTHRASTRSGPVILARLAPAKPTEVYDTYWRFAAERQEIFYLRVAGMPPPWTTDSILSQFKFTNVYRASDRVSQYLIRYVIYDGDPAPQEVFFRTLVFKIFNSIDTWRLLCTALGSVSYAAYSFEQYDAILTGALEEGRSIFSNAYIMPSGSRQFAFTRKHRTYLKLLERLMEDGVPQQIAHMRSMRQVFDLLLCYPLIGTFLAYQYATDLNYSELTDFSEMEFVVPGPGARDGIHKCFESLGGLSEADIIRFVADCQEEEFARLGLHFRTLGGRRLQLIDCQNLFCEVDKYARIAHPDRKGLSGRQRIKQRYHATGEPLTYWYPPKWHLHLSSLDVPETARNRS